MERSNIARSPICPHSPEHVVELIRRALKGEAFISASETFRITTSRSHGAVWAVLSTVRQVGLDKLLGGDELSRSIVIGMIVARLVEPGSKRFTRSYWQQTTLPSLLSLPETLSVNDLLPYKNLSISVCIPATYTPKERARNVGNREIVHIRK